MLGFVKDIVGLMKEVQEMSGGRKRGQVVFWIVFIIVSAILSKPAYDAVAYVGGSLSTIR